MSTGGSGAKLEKEALNPAKRGEAERWLAFIGEKVSDSLILVHTPSIISEAFFETRCFLSCHVLGFMFPFFGCRGVWEGKKQGLGADCLQGRLQEIS